VRDEVTANGNVEREALLIFGSHTLWRRVDKNELNVRILVGRDANRIVHSPCEQVV